MYSPPNIQSSIQMTASKEFNYPRLIHHHQGLTHLPSSSPANTQQSPQLPQQTNTYPYINSSTYVSTRDRSYSTNGLHSKLIDSPRTSNFQRSSSIPSQNSPSPPYQSPNTVNGLNQFSHHYLTSPRPASYPSNTSNSWYNSTSGVTGSNGTIYHPSQNLENIQEWQSNGYLGVEQGFFPWNCCFTDGKRKRTSYTRRQIYDLEKEFTKNRYITRERRIEMSLQLNLSERQIKTWFQNRRMKTKREKPTKTIDSSEALLNSTTELKPLLQANY